jgi:hypothetical protein
MVKSTGEFLQIFFANVPKILLYREPDWLVVTEITSRADTHGTAG